ncbi:hypothetical protein LJK88_10245 [Paenibacillus sp. P26]|nr:hypothetical protein LJK88_10245 [Paenibacillus sp. P26]UUZ89787.1 hypothetical protein LJK87_27420 [Paenibacillus sp. P25]
MPPVEIIVLILVVGVVIVIGTYFHYYVITSALNDAKLNDSLKEMQSTLNEIRLLLAKNAGIADPGPAASATPLPAEPPEEACPACSAPLRPSDRECPDCGLALTDHA